MADPNPIMFDEWAPDKAERTNPTSEAQGVCSFANHYAPFPDLQDYGPDPTIDSNTKVLLHLDGPDTSTGIYDDAPDLTHVWTAVADAKLDEDESKFGGASLILDGTGDYISTPDSADFELGSGDFTIEMWFNCNVLGGTSRGLAGQCDATVTAAGSSWYLRRFSSNQIEFGISNGTNFVHVFSETTYTNALNTGWHHVAITRESGILKLFLDAVQEGGNIAASFTVNPTTNVLTVGATCTALEYWSGWIDEVRISNVARYTNGYETGNDQYTKVLLHFDAPDAATFYVDSKLGATLQHTWTGVGNAQIDTADKKFGAASLLLDGTGDQISMPDNADVTLGSGDWTIDCWFKCLATSGATAALFGQSDAGPTNAASSIYCQRNSSDVLRVFISDGTNLSSIISASKFTDTINTGWHHLAILRTGNVLRMFIDGLQEGGDVAFSVAVNDSSQDFVIGGRTSGATTTWNGWIDEFRISVGIDRFATNSLSLPDSFTKLLVHFDGPDGSTMIANRGNVANPDLFTAAGNAQLDTSDKQFGTASGLFDGAGDWWSAADSANFTLGSNDFCIECWFKLTAAGGTIQRIVGQNDTIFTTNTRTFLIQRLATNALQFTVCNSTTPFSIQSEKLYTDLINPGWHHIACVRTGQVTYLFIDGLCEARAAFVASVGAINDSTNNFRIGAGGETVGQPWTGWLDEMRLSVGTTRYSLGTPGNGNDQYTKILMHFGGPDTANVMYDVAAGVALPLTSRNWTAAANAQIDTSDFKFDGASCLFDGTGDLVNVADAADFTLGSSDFTVDFWFKCNFTGGSTLNITGQSDATPTAAASAWFIQRTAANVIQCSVSNGSAFTSIVGSTQFTDTLNPGWHHLALVRTGNTLKLFIDGVQDGGSVTFSGTVFDAALNYCIGARNSTAVTPWNGWIDEYRLSVGIARWGVDSQVNGNDAFTKVLLHFDGPDTATVIGDIATGSTTLHQWSANAGANTDTAQSKFGGTSLELPNAYVTCADNVDFVLGSEDFTIDFWVRPLTTFSFGYLGAQADSSLNVNNISWLIQRETSGKITAGVFAAGPGLSTVRGTTNVAPGAWYHIAFVRSDTTLMLFVNGVLEDSVAVSGSVVNSTGGMSIGRAGDWTLNSFAGWIDEFRLSVGIARWESNFTPPTSAYGGAVFTPPVAAYGAASFTPPTAAFYPGFSASLPASAYGSTAVSFTLATTAFSWGGGAEDVVIGADTFYDSDTTPHIFFGDTGKKLYVLESRQATDISKSGGYTGGTGDTWQFAQFGDNVVAVSAAVAPQHYVMNTSIDCIDLAGSPPSGATSIARVNDFLWMGKDFTVHWSAFDDITDWTPSSATQAGNQELDQEQGEIMQLIGLDYAAIFQERAIRRAIYVGPPVIWDFGQDYMEKARGAVSRNCAVPFGRMIFYASDDGFYAFDGQSSTAIGYGKVDSYYTKNLNYAFRHKISCGIDRQRKLVVWGIPTGSSQFISELLIFSIPDGRWSHDVIDLEFLFDTPAEPFNVDNFNSLFPANNLDGAEVLPDDIDSASFDDRRIRLAGFNLSHQLGLFVGPNRAAILDTKEFEAIPGRRALLTEVWPIGDYEQAAIAASIRYRRALPGAQLLTTTNPTSMNRAGYCPQRHDARFMRVRQQITAGSVWRRAEGVHITAIPTGKR